MRKILPYRFKQSFGPFDMLTLHKYSDSQLFRYLSNPDFTVYNFTKKPPLRLIYFFKYLKFYVDSGNAAKN